MEGQKKKSLQYGHLLKVLQSDPRMDFLLKSGQFKKPEKKSGDKRDLKAE